MFQKTHLRSKNIEKFMWWKLESRRALTLDGGSGTELGRIEGSTVLAMLYFFSKVVGTWEVVICLNYFTTNKWKTRGHNIKPHPSKAPRDITECGPCSFFPMVTGWEDEGRGMDREQGLNTRVVRPRWSSEVKDQALSTQQIHCSH